MIINLADLRQRNRPSKVRADFAEKQLGIRSPIQDLTRPVRATLVVRLEGDRVTVAGRIDFQLELTCCRCTRRFLIEVDKAFESIYLPDPETVSEGEELELEYSDLEVGFYRDDRIDLSAVISEQIVLEIPMKPVCTESCKGLCPLCGIDLNEGECGCSSERSDPRLAPLAELKKRLIN